MMDEMVYSLAPIFTSIVTTIFIADLQRDSPRVAAHIFDVFLIDGEKVIFTLITTFIQLKEKKILTLSDDELQKYMRYKLPFDCFNELTTQELFNYES